MPLEKRHVERLKLIVKEEHGLEQADAEAREMARRLYDLFRLLGNGSGRAEDKQD